MMSCSAQSALGLPSTQKWFVKGSRADADVGQLLLQASVAEAVAVKTSLRCLGQLPPR
jgi:hypothetical protein